MVDTKIIIQQLKAGDERALRSLFDEYYQALCLFAVKYLEDDAEAADVVQECFIKYWNRRVNFDQFIKIRSFLYMSVRNECLNILRKDKCRQMRLTELTNELFFRDSLIEEESLRLFYQAIESLPAQTKRVVYLSLDGFNNDGIANQLGISVNTVHMLKKIAYKKLRILLREYYYLVFFFLDK